MFIKEPLSILLLLAIISNRIVAQIRQNSSIPKQLYGTRNGATKHVSMVASVNYGGAIGFGPICTVSMDVALQKMISNENWLPGYNFSIELIDDRCQSSTLLHEYGKRVLNEKNQSKGRIPFTSMGYCLDVPLPYVGNIWNDYNFVATTLSTINSPQKLPKTPKSVFELRDNYDLSSYKALAELLISVKWYTLAIFSIDAEYYSSMENILSDPKIGKNLTISYLGPKTSGVNEENIEQIKTAMETLVELEARVILVHVENAVPISCWLHRYGIYGPNYVFFGSTWLIFDPEEVTIPDYLHWCTKDMLKEVVESWIYFGMGFMKEVYGNDYIDSLGLTFRNVVDVLDKNIVDSTLIQTRDIWWPQCYDPTLVALYVVGEAEQILNKKFNSTLSEWTTDSVNFRENGQIISNVFKEAIYQIEVHGTLGFYDFNKETKANTEGLKPNMFYQARLYSNGTFQKAIPVVYYDDNGKSFHTLNGGFLFGESKAIPAGSVKYISYELEIISKPVFLALCILSILEIAVVMFLILTATGTLVCMKTDAHVKQRFEAFKYQDLTMAIGTIFYLSSVFATPHGKLANNVKVYYICHALLMATGFSIVGAGLIWKLQEARKFINPNPSTKWKQMITTKIPILWILFQVTLIAVFIGLGSFDNIQAVDLETFYSKDKTIIYKPYRYEYGIDFFKNAGKTATAVFIVLFASSVVVFSELVFHSYRVVRIMKIQSARFYFENVNSFHAKEDFTLTLNTLMFSSVLLSGIGFLSFGFMSDPSKLVFVSPIAVLAISLAIIIGIYLPKFGAKPPLKPNTLGRLY